MKLIMFVFYFCVIALLHLLLGNYMCRCLHSRRQPWKEATTKEKSLWLMLITLHLGQRGFDFQRECMSLTSSDLMLRFRPMRTTFERHYYSLKEPLTSYLSLTPIFQNGLPLRIEIFFSAILMMRTRTWWKSFMPMPLLKERSSSVGLEGRGSQLHPSTWQKSYTSTGQYYLYHWYMMNWIRMRRFFRKL